MGPIPSPPIANPAGDKEKNPLGGDINKGDNPLAPVTKVEQAGNIVSLASDIIAAGANPFLSRMPKPLATDPVSTDSPTTGATTVVAPPADPLDSLKLLGIVYSPQAPIALVAVEGAGSPSQLVKRGDMIKVGENQATVARITKDSIDIQLVGKQKEKRTYAIPDIVGYGAAKPAAVDSPTSPTLAGEPGDSSSPNTPTPGGPLSNLKNLTAGLAGAGAPDNASGASPKGPTSNPKKSPSPNPVLTEP